MTASPNGIRNASEQPQKSARSKFLAQPGSLYTKQVDYDSRSSAFIPQQITSPSVQKAKQIVIDMKESKRLGKKPQWNSSTTTTPFYKERNQMRQLSTFQSEKIEYDFRAPQISNVYKQVVYIPKKNKFQVDHEKFLDLPLSDTMKTMKGRNIDPRREQKALEEARKDQMLAGRPDWNKTTEVDQKLKENIHKTLTETSLKSTTTKNRTVPGYLSPVERERMRNEQNRQRKREERKRLEEERLRASQTPKVYRLGIRERQMASLLLGAAQQAAQQANIYDSDQESYSEDVHQYDSD